MTQAPEKNPMFTVNQIHGFIPEKGNETEKKVEQTNSHAYFTTNH